MNHRQAPIGVFDSGVGGLSVVRAIRQQLPAERLVFVADQAHVPYGPRPLEEVRDFSAAITRYLLAQGAKVIVVACNTASAAALYDLRARFPQVPFVGMEPAVKPAAEHTASRVVGVLATPATFQGALYASVVERFANGVTVLQHTCPGLVGQIEAGQLQAPETRAILEEALLPMLRQGIDTVVLGCTHYPFVIPLIQSIVGPAVRVIDPAPAVARQVGRVLEAHGLSREAPISPSSLDKLEVDTGSAPHGEKAHPSGEQQPPTGGPLGSVSYLTSGDPRRMQSLLSLLLGEEETRVQKLVWQAGELAG